MVIEENLRALDWGMSASVQDLAPNFRGVLCGVWNGQTPSSQTEK